jgi:hypothetical protein
VNPVRPEVRSDLGESILGEAPIRTMPVVVIRGTDEWRRRVRAGHPDSLFTMVHGEDGRVAEGWHFPPARSRFEDLEAGRDA